MKQTKTKYEKIKQIVSNLNLPNYRYIQLTKAIFHQRIDNFDDMHILPKALRIALVNKFGNNVSSVIPVFSQSSKQAQKLLFELTDGERIEAVRLQYKQGWESFCISFQCGCGFGCRFCATGNAGFKRNLTADEITDQLLYFYFNEHGLNSISFMGMGEAFANPELFGAVKILTDENLFGLSQRRITISTIGVIPGIQRLTKEFPQVNLAFSLHSPFESQRSDLMPINKRFPLHEVMKTLDEHIIHTGRRVFLAYIMLERINDSKEHAKAVIGLLKNRGSWEHLYHLGLIPYNSTNKTTFKFQSSSDIKQFCSTLEAGISVTVRTQFGSEISAACGQLYCENEL
ncbi:ribosomal RNA large subunit methyltransferase Cfr [Clostridium pasteurianum DSM 525 = ATCC 6013]|uniref:Ribosomal RNA large subunit methyltransferase Cfr n=1 Tax=Clostridium pasteurianum DSM 525 = ATCC 6013 TaxID=1262449 RepID=A0A0H3J7R3_CLOPA|nr:Cfr family 23S rRNA (adenine(2503)-C(8))-methyltransferase [Clostridium pasteurianum]AJA49514.1 ribosomal RNA large subunit methyltransferase Cfr [Clostridium pasteurianum DSM 525 = ATCC 6013]AJA53502.1 ribosomal RNA large subunit methyltransferase Cfr [Clostridium pasteurianum DSM 525 = ATCC 6013]AOZ76676.1 23S rRNA (adenine(2503)-C8)-methyltransferase [Clostridium pasteurianum DSM 525 = ATCC 6013]AOZ80473.1 23S rRNA (adenine(2503)-C8)-methyltransferase [Clostridium pasteurianum]ELP58966.1